VSASVVDTWQIVKIWTENVTKIPNRFLPLIHVPLMKQMKTQVLNLKRHKTQVLIGYLTVFLKKKVLELCKSYVRNITHCETIKE
jgi:hypothetical protein